MADLSWLFTWLNCTMRDWHLIWKLLKPAERSFLNVKRSKYTLQEVPRRSNSLSSVHSVAKEEELALVKALASMKLQLWELVRHLQISNPVLIRHIRSERARHPREHYWFRKCSYSGLCWEPSELHIGLFPPQSGSWPASCSTSRRPFYSQVRQHTFQGQTGKNALRLANWNADVVRGRKVT